MKQAFLTIALIETICFMFVGCTISFQNISTHGYANDLVDENQAATADVKPNVEIPLNKN